MWKYLELLLQHCPDYTSSAFQSYLNSVTAIHLFRYFDFASYREKLLVVSPYTSRAHLLDLAALTRSQVLLAKALTILTPIDNAYATQPYTKSFNWDEVFYSLKMLVNAERHVWKEQHFYIVVFKSQIPPTTNRSHLGDLDKRAHAEAMKTGGLLKYWFGVPDVDGRNLATCKYPC